MKKETIKNRKKQKIVTLIGEASDQKGLVFILHGLGGFKEQLHIRMMADVFRERKYTVVNFDATNSVGESDGNCEYASVTNHRQDLEDVIKWAEIQPWYQEPFCLAGHSLGGMAIALYAQKHPKKIKGLAPISTGISGKLHLEIHPKEVLEEWKKTGYQLRKSSSKPGVIKKISWSFMEDQMKYNILEKADKLIMPVLLIVGEKDVGTPPEHQKMLYDKLPGKKELYIIKGAAHTFREETHLKEIKDIFLR